MESANKSKKKIGEPEPPTQTLFGFPVVIIPDLPRPMIVSGLTTFSRLQITEVKGCECNAPSRKAMLRIETKLIDADTHTVEITFHPGHKCEQCDALWKIFIQKVE